ncbi:P-loop containing nucleoside triphosphate hydrolase protein [Saitoella complicata NRRL Y-17804]|uniref:P-loop containing nucleoside triphosphate hydrolase protein n=1 Tax=Saitoella complicata (strain BCRC 22490 / CBS 7301 / JCM 7358 / NBRC 10748 / NRRL Y-17804) TaxID=698492 RepID=UPI00086686BA|nr:P-loop containing nucleoside triphosphate hydrolase protein [Saitoella complicata NRRL Y-17804]ODQ53734.1 P-loop containing nucleoside triphosphate hydrolase protein [Saitoella complicata NRRL Y-17804]
MATLDEVLPCSKDEPRIRGLGHGQSKREAAANAYLHFIYQMQELDILKDYLQGGVNVVDPKNRDQNNDALLDVANFFARFDRVPKLETVKVDTREGKPWSCTLELPEQNIWVRAVAEKASKAQNDACIKFKRAAELWHARNDGDETFVVKDMSHPSADTAGDFLRFAYRQSGGAPSFDLQPSKVGVTATVKDSSGEVLGSAFHNKKQIATDLAQLYAAVYLKQKHPQYWSEFIVKLAEGNGEVLLPITPADMSITDEAWHAMQRTLQHARSLEARVQSLLDSSSQDPDIGLDGTRRRRTKLLPREQYASKSKFLLNRLQEFEKDPKYEELRRKKAELPMCQNKEDVTKIVRENSASVVIGATGSGKTTQLPQLVLDEYILKGRGAECNIICTQPRRIAATSVAERVAVERGETLGQSVGYRVRFKNVPATHGGSITYCTTGTLLTQLQFSADETLQGISHIMIDEVHERDIQIDFLLVVLKRITRARKAAGKDPIKIVLMSATIDPKLFCKYFGEDFESGECPSISIPGRTFPVTHHYLEELDESKYRVYLLHSEIPDAQEKVFEEVPPDVRKIILSTNVAETSITIPDVVYVLDSGKQREKQFDQMSRLTSLACNWVSKSNARQRAGRAGRVQNGHYYTLMSSGRYENMPTHPTPELLRVDLQELALDIKSLGLGDVKSVLDECIESPPSYAVKAALERLTFLQALDEDENMTPLGVMLSKLPVTPQIGKMVLLGTIFRCLDPMIVLAASEGNRNIFFKPVGTTSLQARAGKENICPGLASDHLVLVEAFRRVRQIILENGPAAARGWATANNIRFGTVMTVLRAADQINDVLVSAGLVPRQTWVEKKKSIVFGPEELNKNSRNNSLIRALIYAGLYPNVAMAVTDKLLRTQHENKAIIAMSSTNSFYKRENLTPGSVYCFSGKNRPEGGDKKQGPVLSDTTRISPLAAILFGGNISVSRAVIKIDDWLPFYLGSREARHLLADFSSGLDAFLMRTFDRIKPNGNVLGESDSPSRKQFEPTDVTGMLNADPSRDVWVDGLVNALEKADWSYDDLSYAGRSSRWGL